MNLSLQNMTITNFKGVKALELVFNGQSAAISGCNGCGKSSIVDAFTWCMFGVNANGDSPGSDKFQEKPLDNKGGIVHNLTTSVQLDFLLDRKPFNVKREQSENWVKRRGSIEPVFQGNVSKFFINDVELKKSEFEERISAIISTDTFKQIGILGYFNGMDWKKRRQYLMSLAGNDVDNQLLQKAEHKAIADEIAKRNISVDDLKKVLSDQKKSLTNDLKSLPIRIDEARKSTVEMKPHEVDDAEYMINDTKRDIEKLDQLIIETKAYGSGGKQSQITAFETELALIKRQMQDEQDADKKKLRFELDQAITEAKAYESKISNLKDEADKLRVSLSSATQERDALRKEFITVRAEKAEISDTCPTCGQQLPPDKVEEAHKEWEKNRKKRLLDIQTNGKSHADKVTDLEQKIIAINRDLERLAIDLNEANGNVSKLSDSYGKIPAEPDFKSNPRIAELEKKIEELKSSDGDSDADAKVEQLNNRRKEMLTIIDRANAILAKRDLMAENEARIAEYEKQMQDKGSVLSETELLLDQLDNFTQARCSALESTINNKFVTVKWRLFSKQINGGIVDCCTCMIKCNETYVPIESANTAAGINADIEIINVLSDFYNVHVPTFIDNAERVLDIKQTNSQMITLSVADCDELKVELLD